MINYKVNKGGTKRNGPEDNKFDDYAKGFTTKI